jgi:hypothetical protein
MMPLSITEVLLALKIGYIIRAYFPDLSGCVLYQECSMDYLLRENEVYSKHVGRWEKTNETFEMFEKRLNLIKYGKIVDTGLRKIYTILK